MRQSKSPKQFHWVNLLALLALAVASVAGAIGATQPSPWVAVLWIAAALFGLAAGGLAIHDVIAALRYRQKGKHDPKPRPIVRERRHEYAIQPERVGDELRLSATAYGNPWATHHTVVVTDPDQHEHFTSCKTGTFVYPRDFRQEPTTDAPLSPPIRTGLYRFTLQTCSFSMDAQGNIRDLPRKPLAWGELECAEPGVPGWDSHVIHVQPSARFPVHGLAAKLYGPGGRRADGKVRTILRRATDIIKEEEARFHDFGLELNERPYYFLALYNPLKPEDRLGDGTYELRWIEDYALGHRDLVAPHVFEIVKGSW